MKSDFSQEDFPSSALSAVADKFGTPAYVYSRAVLEKNAKSLLEFPAPYGLTARYAMKALPNAAVVKLFSGLGIKIDASSGYEVLRAEKAGVPARDITLTAQELPKFFGELIERGIDFNACSLHQLETFGRLFSGKSLGLRINPGLGSGHVNRTNTGGPASSFGIWHEQIDRAKEIAAQHNLTISRIHSHIGAGTDPEVWVNCARLTLGSVEKFPTAGTVSLGGGFKVARMPDETSADFVSIGRLVSKELENFSEKHKRKLSIELEPGTFLVANAGVVLSRVIDICDTGKDGYKFIKIDCGMTEILRPSLYGAQHPIWTISSGNSKKKNYLVVGHCCESGDILTPEKGNPEGLLTRELAANIGDLLVIGGAGAYCAGMSAKHYNSFPEAPEIMLDSDSSLKLIRKRQQFEDIMANESALV